MKRVLVFLSVALGACISACTPAADVQPSSVPTEVIQKLKAAGFDTSEGLRVFEDGYLVEYDIYLTNQQINDLASQASPKGGRTQHYRTTNLVTSPRVLSVYMDTGFDTYMQNSFNTALARYNAQNLGVTFQRAASAAGANISILSFYEVSNTLGISAGFPSGGNPASPIRLNTYYYNSSSQRPDAATVIAHEIGHAIGFRHTDYMNRRFSCPNDPNPNEGPAGVGAVHIPGTPTAPSVNSWMLACSNNTDRPFTGEDQVALRTVYPRPPAPGIDKLVPGQQLLQNQFIRSTDGRFILVLQGDGNLVLYQGGTPLWSSGTWGKPYITRCIMQTDGNLVLYDNAGRAYWSTGTFNNPGSYLLMQNDGNLVIYYGAIAVWNTRTCCR